MEKLDELVSDLMNLSNDLDDLDIPQEKLEEALWTLLEVSRYYEKYIEEIR